MSKIASRRDRAILALLVEPTIVAAAARAGVAEVTLHRWFKDPQFRREYDQARRRYLDEGAAELARQGAARAGGGHPACGPNAAPLRLTPESPACPS
jgi:hypothetical protein